MSESLQVHDLGNRFHRLAFEAAFPGAASTRLRDPDNSRANFRYDSDDDDAYLNDVPDLYHLRAHCPPFAS